MNRSDPTTNELLAYLHDQGLVSQEEIKKIAESSDVAEQKSGEPAYIRILSGIGAWFASLFLILFLAFSGIVETSASSLILGIIFLAIAIVISRESKGTFLSQFSLCLAFSGNILILVGAAREFNVFFGVVMIQAVICTVTYPLYSSSVYRFLAPIGLAALATAWIAEEKVFGFMHILIATEMILAGILFLPRKKLHASLRPLAYSSAFMLPATLLFMNLTQVNIWRNNFDEPLWPSSILLAAGLIYLWFYLGPGLKRFREPWLILAVLSTILLGIFTTPGVLVAIGLLVLGYAFDDTVLSGLSYVFMPCFLVLFYYALNIDLAHKSWVIAGSGVILLVVRQIAAQCRPGEVSN